MGESVKISVCYICIDFEVLFSLVQKRPNSGTTWYYFRYFFFVKTHFLGTFFCFFVPKNVLLYYLK